MTKESAVQFDISTTVLKKALDHLHRLVEGRGAIQIRSHLLFEAKEKHLVITATDPLLTAEETVEASVQSEGRVTLSSFLIHSIVSQLEADKQLRLDEIEPQMMSIDCGRAHFDVSGLDPKLFDPLEREEAKHRLRIAAQDLLALLNAVHFTISTDETRPYLHGLFIEGFKNEQDEPTLRFVGTDGHRMAIADKVLDGIQDDMPSIIVPRKTVTELQSMLLDAEGTVDIEFSDSQITLLFDNLVLVSRLIAADFPNYRKVIPEEDEGTEMVIDADDFKTVLKRVASVFIDKSKNSIVCEVANNMMTVSASDSVGGRAREEMNVLWKGTEALTKGYNVHYLMNICETLRGRKMRFLFCQGSQPTLILPQKIEKGQQEEKDEGEHDKKPSSIEAFYILMPTRV